MFILWCKEFILLPKIAKIKIMTKKEEMSKRNDVDGNTRFIGGPWFESWLRWAPTIRLQNGWLEEAKRNRWVLTGDLLVHSRKIEELMKEGSGVHLHRIENIMKRQTEEISQWLVAQWLSKSPDPNIRRCRGLRLHAGLEIGGPWFESQFNEFQNVK